MKTKDILAEKFEDSSEDQLIQELIGQFINIEKFMPKRADMSKDRREALKAEIYKNAGAYKGIAQDIIDIVNQMKKKGLA